MSKVLIILQKLKPNEAFNMIVNIEDNISFKYQNNIDKLNNI